MWLECKSLLFEYDIMVKMTRFETEILSSIHSVKNDKS